MQYQSDNGSIQFDLVPQPATVTLDRSAAPVLLPSRDRIVECRDIGDPSGLLASQLADDIQSVTGLRWDVAKDGQVMPAAGSAVPSRHWRSFITLTLDTAADGTAAGGAAPLAPQSYRLTIAPTGIAVVGGDTAGVRNGVQTLRQIIRQCGMALPLVTVEDIPAYAVRGYYLDATRGRVPTLAWLKQWADLLCLYKYNQLQLYIEHTFMFDGLNEAWRGTSPLKPADIVAFDDYCADRGIELVPSVSTFGHHYMALRTRELRRLGEFPEDADRAYSFVERQRHHTLNITESDSFALSLKLIDDYLQLFRTRKFNICGDETFDLGRGRSRAEAERRGVATMYAGYVSALCDHLSQRGYEPMFWGDIAVEHPEILSMLPSNVTLLNWLYAPAIGDDKVRLVAESGAPQYVCSAVWCWNALLPRLDDAWNNISRLARYGVKYGAAGYLVTDWGDYGHVNDPRMAAPGMMYGAQAAWNPLADVSAGASGNAGCCADGDAATSNPSSSEGDDYTGGTADQAAGAPSGPSAEGVVEMSRRVAAVEYGDRSGDLLNAVRDASCRVTFGFDDMVWYCELDEGDGRFNKDVAAAVHFSVHGFPGRYASEWDARLMACDDLDAARRTVMQALAPHVVRAAESNRALREDLLRLGTAAVRASRLGAVTRDLSAFSTAIDGQRWFNLAGLCLAVREGVISFTDVDVTAAADGLVDEAAFAGGAFVDGVALARETARGLERWFETYCDVWRTVSAESELRRIASVIWRIADFLRA